MVFKDGGCNECEYFIKALNGERKKRRYISFKSKILLHIIKRVMDISEQDSVWKLTSISNLPKGGHNPVLNQYLFFIFFLLLSILHSNWKTTISAGQN